MTDHIPPHWTEADRVAFVRYRLLGGKASTTMIDKYTGPAYPGDTKPITVASMLQNVCKTLEQQKRYPEDKYVWVQH